MLGRPTRELRGDWEGVYRSDMVPGYPEGRFTWKVRSGLVWGVVVESVDHTRQIPATLTGSFRGGELRLIKQYPPGELPVLQPDGSMVSIDEALASERMQGSFRRAAEAHLASQGREGASEEEVERLRALVEGRYRQEFLAGAGRVEYTGRLVGLGRLEGEWCIPGRAMPSFGIPAKDLRGTWSARRSGV